MSINPLLLALQGVGFPLTPIALAVQGLIAQIQEELRSQIYGSGKSIPVPADWNTEPEKESDEYILQKVREKWDVIEAARARDLVPPPEKSHISGEQAPASPKTSKTIAYPVVFDVLVPGDSAQKLQALRERNAVAMLLLLAEV